VEQRNCSMALGVPLSANEVSISSKISLVLLHNGGIEPICFVAI